VTVLSGMVRFSLLRQGAENSYFMRFGTASTGWTKLYEVDIYDFCILYSVTQTVDGG